MAETKKVAGKMRNFTTVTSIYTPNAITIVYKAGSDDIETVEINDGTTKKTLTMTYDGTNRLTGFTTAVAEV